MKRNLTPGRVKAARVIAIVADVLEISLFPVFFEGFASPANDILDAAVAITLFALLGWHWAFLPAFAAEMVPALTLVPTWTASVMLATRGYSESDSIDVTPPTPPASDPGPPSIR